MGENAMYLGKTEKIIATIEARMTSSRLPGKVLLPLAASPALQRIVERIRRSRYVDEVVVATTINIEDDPIEDLCLRIGCQYYRGSEYDVLQRVLDAAHENKADLIVEITGDCPLVDHRHIDHIIDLYYSGDYDYASNTIERSFPDGFDVQVYKTRILEIVDQLTDDPIDRVHVSYYIYTHPERFKLVNWRAEGELYWPGLGLTLDEQYDYELLKIIYEKLMPINKDFSAEDVVSLLRKNPKYLEINAHVRRKNASEG